MSTLQKFIDKVEKAINDFVESGPEANDPALIRLHQEEEALLEEVKSINITRAGRSLFTCASVFGALIFGTIGYLTAWPTAIMILLAMTGAVAGVNGYAMFQVRQQLDELEGRHDRLLISMDKRKKKRSDLVSTSKGEQLILALDGLDEKMPRGSKEAIEAREFVRDKIRTLKRERLMPLLNYRERKARYLLNRDPEGLAKEVQNALERQAEHEAELDVESGMILERTITAKRETLEKLADADREFTTIELTLESLQSQIEQLEAIIAQGEPIDKDELNHILEEMDCGLELAPGMQPKALPPGDGSTLPPA